MERLSFEEFFNHNFMGSMKYVSTSILHPVLWFRTLRRICNVEDEETGLDVCAWPTIVTAKV